MWYDVRSEFVTTQSKRTGGREMPDNISVYIAIYLIIISIVAVTLTLKDKRANANHGELKRSCSFSFRQSAARLLCF
ncbi:MAG: hypothetical protein FWH07_06755 [Oscillospiraceae bacterium]|nr:hypothetical protein [Oscillospiraceae bacterium]